MGRHTDFDTKIFDVDVNVKAYVVDGEIDEFTVYVGDTIVTDILDDRVIDLLQEEALYNVSDENIAADEADFKLKGE